MSENLSGIFDSHCRSIRRLGRFRFAKPKRNRFWFAICYNYNQVQYPTIAFNGQPADSG